MKNFKSIALALVALVTFTATAQKSSKVDASKSTINWVGKKVTGSHEGTITLKEGTLIKKNSPRLCLVGKVESLKTLGFHML